MHVTISVIVLGLLLGRDEASRIQQSKLVPRLYSRDEFIKEKRLAQQGGTSMVVVDSSFVQASLKPPTILGRCLSGDYIIGIIFMAIISLFIIAVLVYGVMGLLGRFRSLELASLEETFTPPLYPPPPHDRLCPRITHLHDDVPIYDWDQNFAEVNIYMMPPPNVDKEDLEIKIASGKLKVGRKGKPPFLQEDLYATIIEQESSWKLRGNGELKIQLRKAKLETWPHALMHKSDQATGTSWVISSPCRKIGNDLKTHA